MRILNITICNFRNFKGEYSIDFRSNDGNSKNVILIGGVNGAGKTTIFESIKLCMFGKRFNGSTMSKKEYKDYIKHAKNKSSIAEGDNRYFIQMEIEIEDTFPKYSITLRREWVIEGTSIEENFKILRNGKPLEIIPREYWEDYVNSITPPYISNYFFFDGERIKELSTGNGAEEILRESIRDLIGLKHYETLTSDLESLASKIKRRNVGQKKLENRIREKETKISKLDKEIGEIDTKISRKQSEINELNDKKEEIERNLRRKAGDVAKERKKNEDRLFKLREELNSLDSKIMQTCEVIPFILASDVREKLVEQLEEEKRLKNLKASKNVIEEVNKRFVNKLIKDKSKNFSKDQLEDIKDEVNNIFSEMSEEIDKETKEPLIHDLTIKEMDNLEDYLNNVEEKARTEFNKILSRREDILYKIKKINEELKQVPDESFVKDYIEELASLRTNIEFLEKEIDSLKERKWTLFEEKGEIEVAIKDLEEKIICAEEDERKIDTCIRTKKSLKEFTDFVISTKTKELEEIITKIYYKLSNKNDMVKEIKINSNDFTTSLIDYSGNIVNKENISAGEKEIYALAVLWGLSKISQRKFPLVVDSLLARLDSGHVDKVVENFFPNSGEQVIILAHDREIDQESYHRLLPYISKEFKLSLDEENKIHEGYFYS
ncbi:MAG: DNA sulfur modification protein DndD [Promethearchaeota archaeon]